MSRLKIKSDNLDKAHGLMFCTPRVEHNFNEIESATFFFVVFCSRDLAIVSPNSTVLIKFSKCTKYYDDGVDNKLHTSICI